MTSDSRPLDDKSGVPRERLSPHQIETLIAFCVEPELERHALGRQAISLYYADGTPAHKSARSTLQVLVERDYLSIVTNGRNWTAYRLTAKGRAYLDD